MAAAWLGRGFGRGVRTRGGYGRGRGIVKRYERNDFNVFAALSDPTTMSDTECETSDTEATGSDTNDDGYTTVTRKHTKAKRRRVSSGGRSSGKNEGDTMPVHEFVGDTNFDTLSTDDKLSLILAKLSVNESKVGKIERLLGTMTKKEKRVSEIETVVRSHNDRLRLLEYKSLDIEARSRRNNLVIHGFLERRNEDCASRVIGFLQDALNLESADSTWIERAHRLGRYDRTRAARPIIVAFSCYRHIESIMANVNRLRGTDFSVNRDLPAEITRARKILWPKLKQIRQDNPLSKAMIVFPAKIILDGRVVDDMFPEWENTLRGSRIDASHPSQQTFKRQISGDQLITNQPESFDMSQSLLNQRNDQSDTPNRPTTLQFDSSEISRAAPTEATGTSKGPSGGAFVRPDLSKTMNPSAKERKSRSTTRKPPIHRTRSVSVMTRQSPTITGARSQSTVRNDLSDNIVDGNDENPKDPPKNDLMDQ